MRSAALLLGQLAGVVALAFLQATLYLTVGIIAGVRPESGVLGINPVSYLIEGIRSLIITGWDLQALLLGFGLAIGIGSIALSAAGWALRGRLARS